MTNTYYVTQDLASFSTPGDTMGAAEVSIRPIGERIRVVFNENLTINFILPRENTVAIITDVFPAEVEGEDNKGAPEVPPTQAPDLVPPKDTGG